MPNNDRFFFIAIQYLLFRNFLCLALMVRYAQKSLKKWKDKKPGAVCQYYNPNKWNIKADPVDLLSFRDCFLEIEQA